MAAGEEEQKKAEGKGFAGLSSLVSDVDTTPPPAAKKEPTGAATSAERPASQPAQPQPQASERQTYEEPAQPSSGSSGGKWVLGIAAVIGVLWLIGQSNKNTTSPAPAYTPPAQSTAPSYSPPAQPQVPSRPQESKPPVGQDLVFSTAQIRYCLAEDIRMDGAKSAVNSYIDSDVDRFNAMVADYNSRCGSFRYRSGALESARRDVEPYRSQLQAEGRSRFARSPSTGSLSAPAPARPAPDATVQAIQRKLNELGYEAGTADGLMGRGTRSAIIAFQRDMGLTQDGQPDGDLLALLNSASSVARNSNTARPNRDYSPEQSAAPPSRSAPDALPPQQTQPASVSRDAKNFSVCVSGQYPSLCNYALLTPDEKVQVAAAERRVNFQTCASGNYPSLCKRSLLTPEEATQVAAAERRVNFQTCVSGNYPSLCKHSLLTSDEAIQVAAAERRVNFQTCISGQYPSLCKHSLLTPDEAARVADAERRAGNR
ncbi:peptidoglycan-binding protein [Pseudomonas aeruginosa]|uniref:Putative peptidoglycan binding protein n=1 Tax=Sinimarinibacterium flocculans TaxID=985250 RepID=A0A318E579_9GAMM|nr:MULTISPECIES: peptidoglycan-binding domain-containing protein [Gammaproteobacteria]MCK1895262.1 peptidoglycan-binding protein [Pseudomonas aeruginosa]MDY1227120.1 peptidoglycan-binding protein [Pseudomonas aeruginosa]PXV63215.1 putative peptidoglycan binding protein [Sinimarinibacterium flocculans]UPL36965.1 peptidoglycan-binding protein [Pseudomonas aeruginosa]